MILEKAKAKMLGFDELFLSCFLVFPKSKKNYEKNSGTWKHALVNNNKESIIESKIMRLFKVGWFQHYKFMKPQNINYKKQSYFVSITCYFHTIRRFCFLENANADNICKVI